MPRTLQQSVVLPASPARLYATYLDPKTHAAITGESGTALIQSAEKALYAAQGAGRDQIVVAE